MLLAGLLAIACAGCGGSGRRPALPLGRWLSVDTPKKTVTLRLIAAYNGVYGGFNFNGYGKGQMLVDISRGWRVRVSCTNDATDVRHSCAIVRGAGATAPAFPGWASSRPQVGVPPHGSTSFSFVAAHAGGFRIACLVPGHETSGMWDVLDVTRGHASAVVLLRHLPP